MKGSWLFPDGVDRDRMLDMDRRISPVRRAAFGVLGLALLASGPWLGWWTILPLVLAAVVFRVAEVFIGRAQRPEIGLFAAWAMSQVIIAVSVGMTGGPESPTLAWFAIPLVTLSARFSERGIALGVVFSIALMLGMAFGVNAAAVIDDPTPVIAALALMMAMGILNTVLMRSEKDTRAEAVIDPLTSMLNRKALEARAAELTAQSAVTPEPVGLIVADLDHFKGVNDRFGHATGDAVLKDVAHLIRNELRAFDFAYRIGGEEFVVLVPGGDLVQTRELADTLRGAIESTTVGGQNVTMSFGVSASRGDEPLDYDALFADADRALYAAKAAGRNRVHDAAHELAA
jgi:diguanylate cyclase (GGDEF)-like protein